LQKWSKPRGRKARWKRGKVARKRRISCRKSMTPSANPSASKAIKILSISRNTSLKSCPSSMSQSPAAPNPKKSKKLCQNRSDMKATLTPKSTKTATKANPRVRG
jgi:hypothetical protein